MDNTVILHILLLLELHKQNNDVMTLCESSVKLKKIVGIYELATNK